MAAPGSPAIEASRAARERMVRDQLEGAISAPSVLAAMRAVPRDRFVPLALRDRAYDDEPLPIGGGQTISQPFMVAAMTELAQVGPGRRVLEIGTGSGYQAAVLATTGAEVWSIEIDPLLAARAAAVLRDLGFDDTRVHLRTGDGGGGWPEPAPFDAIVVTAAPKEVPPALLAQLAVGGRLVIPVGGHEQSLRLLTRVAEDRFEDRSVFAVRFVPLTGDAQRHT